MTTNERASEIASQIGEQHNVDHIAAILERHGSAAADHALERASKSERPGPEFFRSIQESKKTRKKAGQWPTKK